MKDLFFLVVGIIVIVGSFYLFLQKPAPAPTWRSDRQVTTDNKILKIGDSAIVVEIADTEEKRNLGLSGRASLESDHGLLFIFELPGEYGFWMKEMNFPIDIVWIDESWRVVSVEREVDPKTYPQIFYPPRAIKYVLEVPAGTTLAQGIDIGSIVYWGE